VVLIALGVGLLAVVISIGVMFMIRRRSAGEPFGSELTADQWIALGVVFTGAGVALVISLGPGAIALLAVGAIYLAMGVRMKGMPQQQ